MMWTMQTETPDPQSLEPTAMIDSDHPTVQAFALTHATGTSNRERAVALFYAVRDGFRYDPYRVNLAPDGMRASGDRSRARLVCQ